MNTFVGKILCWINYYTKRNNPMKNYLSLEDFGAYCGIQDNWWYV